MSEPAELRSICIDAADAGARVLRELYDRPRDIHFKGRIDLVTDADRASEARVLQILEERAPGAKVLAEESGERGAGDLRFIVDPLDGTTNYAHGLPLFCCTVAAELRGRVVAGCTVDPCREETFSAARGLGASLHTPRGEREIHVSNSTDLTQALVCTGFPYERRDKLPEMVAAFARFTELGRGSRRLGSAALDLAYVAAGRLDGFWETGLKAWDVGAGVVLIEEAGGVVTHFDGSALDLTAGEILASGPGLHGAMMAVLAETRTSWR